MKKIRLNLLLSLFASILMVTSCHEKDPSKEEDKPDPTENTGKIKPEDLLGKYEITSYLLSNDGGARTQQPEMIGNIWQITSDSIIVACQSKMAYTFNADTISVGDTHYFVTQIDNTFELLSNASGVEVLITLTPTDKTCNVDDPGPGPIIVGDVELDKLYGYATLDGGTIGGENATSTNIHHFNNGNKFREWLALREKAKSKVPAIVWLSGTFTKDNGRAANSPWFDIKETENITIYGTDNFKMQNIGFFLVRTKNIIIRNVYIVMPKADGGADGISMQGSNNVWVDHCTFESANQSNDYEDGSCDITHGTYNVTVSWCHFIKTQKSCLVGHSDSQTGDVQIKATFHHNFFDLSSSRHPRVRYGTVHVYNNFFNKVSTYGVGSAFGAKVLVEDNYFDGVTLPTDICTFPAKLSGSSWVSNLTGKVAGYLYANDNTYENKPVDAHEPYPFTNVEYTAYNGAKISPAYTYADFKPSYSYIVDDPNKINLIVPSGAGVGKLGYIAAPIEVNNGGIEGEDPGVIDPVDPGTGTEIGGDWLGIEIGDAGAVNTVNTATQSITMTGKGKFETDAQSFNFVYQEITGDFVITARLDNYTTAKTGNSSQAGLLFTTDITAIGNNFIHALGGSGFSTAGVAAYYYSNRLSVIGAGRGNLAAPSSIGGQVYLKLERTSNAYKASYSLDGGITYGTAKTASFTAELPAKLYVGFAVNSGDNSKAATATFSDIKINGEATTFGND